MCRLVLSTLLVLARLALAAASSLVTPSSLHTSSNMRVVVIPDTHGDYRATLRSLHLAYTQIEGKRATVFFSEFVSIFDQIRLTNKLPKKPITTSPKRSVLLVQLGDLVDRGPDSVGCVEVFRNLESVLGWTVRVLYGNHEVMSMLGESDRYIHRRELARVGGLDWRHYLDEPGGEMHRAIHDMSVGVVTLTAGKGVDVPPTHPRNPNTLFVHAGIDMRWFKKSRGVKKVNGINDLFWLLAGSLRGLNELNLLNSPLWTRDFSAIESSVLCGDQLETILNHFKVARIIVGHSPLDEMRVRVRCGGRIILTDVKMSRWMFPHVDEYSIEGGRPMALIMTMGDDGLLDSIVAHYTDLRTGTEDEQTVVFPTGIGHRKGYPFESIIKPLIPEWRAREVQTWEKHHNASHRVGALVSVTTTLIPGTTIGCMSESVELDLDELAVDAHESTTATTFESIAVDSTTPDVPFVGVGGEISDDASSTVVDLVVKGTTLNDVVVMFPDADDDWERPALV